MKLNAEVFQKSLQDASRSINTAVGRGEEEERWSQQQVQFVEDARNAARRALYFVQLLEPDSDQALLNHVNERVRTTLQSVPITGVEERCGGARGDCGYSGAFETFAELADRWSRMITTCEAGNPTYSSLIGLEDELAGFLRRSVPLDPGIRWTYARLPSMAQLMKQHLGFLCGLAAALAILLGVEPVLSLFRNRPLFGGLALAFAVSPIFLVSIMGARIQRRRGRTPAWDVGGRVARRVSPVVLKPEPWVPWHPRDHGLAKRIYVGLAIKIGLYLAIWLLFGATSAAIIRVAGLDEVFLTVYLIAVALALVVAVGAAIDFADIHAQAPLRGLMIAGTVGFLLMVLVTDRAWLIAAWPLVWGVMLAWWAWRVRQPRVIPVVIVVGLLMFIGVTSTSARHAEDRWVADPSAPTIPPLTSAEWPRGGAEGPPVVILVASGGGSRAAIMTALTLESLEQETPEIVRNLQAISSVSGGSLANAAYVAQRLRSLPDFETRTLPACDGTLADAAKQDFLRPTLLGVFFGGGRARGIQRAWQECPVGLGSVRIGELGQAWRAAGASDPGAIPFPVPIFNSVTLDRHAVVITPLDAALFDAPYDSVVRSPDFSLFTDIGEVRRRRNVGTWVHFRSGIYHLSDLAAGFDPMLSEAVRASANFPFGFPLVEIATPQPLWYSPRMFDREDNERIVRLTDGGALSNSGLWPLLPLLLNDPDRLRDRGILLVIVDASRMPRVGATDRQRGLLETILDQAPRGERSHLQLLAQLEAAYGPCFGYVQLALDPLAETNVYTSWALDQQSLDVLNAAFDRSWRAVKPELNAEFRRLEECREAADMPRRIPLRVPLS